jgi:hypothetical protein
MAHLVRRNGDVRELLGDPMSVAREMSRFRRSAATLSSRRERLLAQYPEQWVAVHDGKVKAHAKTFDALLGQIEKKRLPRGQLILRYISKRERAMIL